MDHKEIKKQIPSKLKHVVIFVIMVILYNNINDINIDFKTCNSNDSGCIEQKQSVTMKSIIKQICIALIIAIGIWQLLYIFGSDPSTMFASAGISVAIIGLSFKPLLDEYIQGTHLIFQKRIMLYDKVHVFTKWGRWFPELHEEPVNVIGLYPTFFTFKHQDGRETTMNTGHINGFKITSENIKDIVVKSSAPKDKDELGNDSVQEDANDSLMDLFM